jgi:hypothetical protein
MRKKSAFQNRPSKIDIFSYLALKEIVLKEYNFLNHGKCRLWSRNISIIRKKSKNSDGHRSSNI